MAIIDIMISITLQLPLLRMDPSHCQMGFWYCCQDCQNDDRIDKKRFDMISDPLELAA